jgi:hypothetical protein
MQEYAAEQAAKASGKGASNAVSAHLRARRSQAQEARGVLADLKKQTAEGKILPKDYATRRDTLLQSIKNVKRNEINSMRNVPTGVAEGHIPGYSILDEYTRLLNRY